MAHRRRGTGGRTGRVHPARLSQWADGPLASGGRGRSDCIDFRRYASRGDEPNAWRILRRTGHATRTTPRICLARRAGAGLRRSRGTGVCRSHTPRRTGRPYRPTHRHAGRFVRRRQCAPTRAACGHYRPTQRGQVDAAERAAQRGARHRLRHSRHDARHDRGDAHPRRPAFPLHRHRRFTRPHDGPHRGDRHPS